MNRAATVLFVVVISRQKSGLKKIKQLVNIGWLMRVSASATYYELIPLQCIFQMINFQVFT